MAVAYKVLGQVNPAAITATTAYTVPSSTDAVISTITVCNTGSYPTTYRIAIRPAGETLATKHYIAYDVSIGSLETQTLTLGLTLDTTDVVTVYAQHNILAFNLFGSEIS
jgi:hypothetical protein